MKPTILLALLATVTFGGTVKVPLKTGWRFMKADDPAAGTNLTMQAMSAVLDRAARGDTANAPDFTWVFSNTTVQKHQFFGAQPSSQSNSHIHT